MLDNTIQRIILTAPPILFALTVHECAHAYTAWKMGDPTARMLGRVTLNPLKHLDPIGTLALFFSGLFGWAKPVPINPLNFRDFKKGMILVALAGPASNLVLAALFSMVHKFVFMLSPELVLSAQGVSKPLLMMLEVSIILNVSLAVFNMIPIPPLDGSRVLSNLLKGRSALAFDSLERYGFIILILLIVSGLVDRVVSPLVFLTAGLLVGGGF